MTTNSVPVLRSAERTLRILAEVAHLTHSHPMDGVDLQEICVASKLPRATVHRMLGLLCDKGFLHFDSASRRYRLGIMSAWIGAKASEVFPLRDVAHPILQALAKESGETVSLNVLIKDRRLCLDRVDGEAELRVVAAVNCTYPPHIGSSGKLLLSLSPVLVQNQILSNLHEGGEMSDLEGFRDELKAIRQAGWCVTHGERVRGVTGLSVPIHFKLAGIFPEAALTIAVPTIRLSDTSIASFLDMLRAAAQKIGDAF